MKSGLFKLSWILALSMSGTSGSLYAAEKDWEWSATFYAWMSSIDTGVSVNGREVGEIDLSFSDILDKLDFTLMLHGEGFRDQWGFFADYLYLGISDKDKKTQSTVKSSIDSSIIELAGVYRPSAALEGIEAFAGLRYFAMDVKLDIKGEGGNVRTRSDEGYADFMVGARYTGRINENWFYRLRADASGGDTDGTWSLLASAGYQFGGSQDKSLLLGYRHMEINLEDDQGAVTVRNELEFSGPFVAFNFTF